jgi:hypothetical protein
LLAFHPVDEKLPVFPARRLFSLAKIPENFVHLLTGALPVYGTDLRLFFAI